MYQAAFDQHIARFDWSSSALGPRERWSPDLKKAVRYLLDNVQPMFLLWGHELTFIFNGQFAPILGPRWRAALGAPLPVLWSEIWSVIKPFVAEALEGRGGLAEDVPLLTWASGFSEIGYYTFSFTPVKDDAGKVLGGTCICTDTSEKVRTACAAKRERNRLIRMFENTPGFIAMTERPSHRFTFANRAYLQLTGHESLVGQTVQEAMPALVEQGFVELLDHVYRSGQSFKAADVEVALPVDGDGPQSRTAFVNFIYEAMRDDNGDICGIFCEGYDVTDARRDREKVQALQSALIQTSRQSAMGAMAATLAHELNQPLTAIASYASAARNLSARSGHGNSALSDCLEGVAAAAMRAGDVIKSVRRLSRSDNGARKMAALDEVVREAAQFALVGSEGAGITVTYKLASRAAVQVEATQIQQVIINLVQNSVDTLQNAADKQIKIASSVEGAFARVSITDSGKGIRPELLESVFDSFVTTKEDGLGMGLSISRTIVEAHGGILSAHNRPSGCTFSFTLPVDQRAATELPE